MAELSNLADHFGIDNIPFGVASSESHPSPQCVTRFENSVIYLADLAPQFHDLDLPMDIFSQHSLNEFAALGKDLHKKMRSAIQALINSGSLPASSQEEISTVQMHMPVLVGDFTDFSCCPSHNRNAGQALLGMARSLPAGYRHHPLGYAGRCSSINVSGTSVRRPLGQYFQHGREGLQGKDTTVVYGPCEAMDYELEMAVVIGKPVPQGEYVTAASAHDHIFGWVLLNDWSARDIQQLEMIPVGPLNSKNIGTTISAWIITPEALAPWTIPFKKRDEPVAPHLANPNGMQLGVDVEVSVDGTTWGRTNVNEMDWTFEHLIAQQSSAGCGLRSGDILAIGTISGPNSDEQGCLLEQFVPGGTVRREYLKDDEEVRLLGYCGRGVGFGECRSRLLPALHQSIWTAPASG